MRSSHVATTLAALTAGLTAGLAAGAALHRRAGRRVPAAAAITASTSVAPVLVPARDGVVLPFPRPAESASASEQPAVPARCGDNGGRTKAGAPCAARATNGGRCHHHRLAA